MTGRWLGSFSAGGKLYTTSREQQREVNSNEEEDSVHFTIASRHRASEPRLIENRLSSGVNSLPSYCPSLETILCRVTTSHSSSHTHTKPPCPVNPSHQITSPASHQASTPPHISTATTSRPPQQSKSTRKGYTCQIQPSRPYQRSLRPAPTTAFSANRNCCDWLDEALVNMNRRN